MTPTASNAEVVNLVLSALEEQGLQPEVIPRGSVNELKGGSHCIALKPGLELDAAIILSRTIYDQPDLSEFRSKYRISYAVRGTIRRVLPNRILSRIAYGRKGFFVKTPTCTGWEVPTEDRGTSMFRVGSGFEGLPPSRGELWEGGPHQTLTGRLNGDVDLGAALMELARALEAPFTVSVVSDSWGESLRICGDAWLDAHNLPSAYLAPGYVGSVTRIARHIREVKRTFGGLTF
jgi:hypothetical protein